METYNCSSETFSNKHKAYEHNEKEFYSWDSFLLIDVENKDISYYECFTPLKLSPIEKSKSLTDLIGNKNVKRHCIASSSNQPYSKKKESVLSSSDSDLNQKEKKLKYLKNSSIELKFKKKLDFYKEEVNPK